jgi:diguanylate cyclase (GGDEF)-like protein
VIVFSPYRTTEKYSAELHQLLAVEVEDHHLLATVASLAQEHGNCVYKEMLLLMVGKHFGAELAESYWLQAIRHCQKIYRPEFAVRGFRPALMDYLRHVVGELSDPRIIEADYLHNISRSSVTDGLTGLYNQTYFKNILADTIVNQRRTGDQNFALILLDLDHFKQYNDRCGHLAGDEALRLCAELITATLRDGDMAVRYGGEEFALLLPQMDRHTAYAVAERIRKSVENYPFPHQDRLDNGNLTISGGVAVFPANGETADAIIKAADADLYRAKERRNTIYTNDADRRTTFRRQIRSLVEYASFDGALYRPALSLDISENGMGLGCESLLSEGMTLTVRLTRPYWPQNMHLSATVRQVRRQDELIYIGLEFDESLYALEELLAKQKSTYAKAHC